MNGTFTRAATFVAMLLATAPSLLGQTVVKPPKNKFNPQQDVDLGREAAAEVRKKYPIINDEKISQYLAGLGNRLVAAAPPELKQSVYQYSFTPVNLKEINAFALPGGPMFVYRGMFDAAANEAEVAGVMAHELSHVLLRHGTANETKAENPWLRIGEIAGSLGGSVVGGAAGEALAQGSQFGLGTLLLRYSRDYEKQADILGSHIMAQAGYDPRSLAHMFETIEKQAQSGGGDPPQWLSDHPNPGNRTDYINKEAALLTVASPAADTSGFEPIKKEFAALSPAKSMGDLAQARKPAGGSGFESAVSSGTPGQPIQPASSDYRTIRGGGVFQADVPSNWNTTTTKSTIRVFPQNGYGQVNGETVFSHGIEFGLTPAGSRDLQQATNAFLNAISQSNPQLSVAGSQKAVQLSQRTAIATPLVNPSPIGGQERIALYTTFLADGRTLFYYLTVTPEGDLAALQDTFRHIGASIRLTDMH